MRRRRFGLRAPVTLQWFSIQTLIILQVFKFCLSVQEPGIFHSFFFILILSLPNILPVIWQQLSFVVIDITKNVS